MLGLALLLGFVFAHLFNRPTEAILPVAAGLLYSIIFLFHSPLERAFVARLEQPLRGYGVAVVLYGLVVETIAYLANVRRIKSGEPVWLFATDSLIQDLVMGLPYYLVLAWAFTWGVKRFVFSTFQLGVLIWATWSIATDEFKHVIALLGGNVVDFCVAGFMMLFTLHAPIVLFEKKLAAAYPARSDHWKKYPIVFGLQLLSLPASFALGFVRYNILHWK